MIPIGNEFNEKHSSDNSRKATTFQGQPPNFASNMKQI